MINRINAIKILECNYVLDINAQAMKISISKSFIGIILITPSFHCLELIGVWNAQQMTGILVLNNEKFKTNLLKFYLGQRRKGCINRCINALLILIMWKKEKEHTHWGRHAPSILPKPYVTTFLNFTGNLWEKLMAVEHSALQRAYNRVPGFGTIYSLLPIRYLWTIIVFHKPHSPITISKAICPT